MSAKVKIGDRVMLASGWRFGVVRDLFTLQRNKGGDLHYATVDWEPVKRGGFRSFMTLDMLRAA